MRKRTNKHVPSKGRLRDMCDQLWSRAIRDDWANRCAVCGKRKTEAHHLIPRANYATRYDLRNGVALCFQHHKADAELAPHMNAAGFLDWFGAECPEQAEWYWQNARIQFTGIKNVPFFIDVIRKLKEYVSEEDFERIVGIRFSTYLEINEQ